MARPQSDGLMYFSLDTDFFEEDKRLRRMKTKYGGAAYLFYIYLLTRIYRNGYYLRWNEDEKDDCIDELGFTEGFIEQAMEYLFTRSLLTEISTPDKSVTIITSPGIQKRWQAAVKDRRRPFYVEPEIWLLKPKDTAAFIKFTKNPDNPRKNPDNPRKNPDNPQENAINEKKRNKNKINETKQNYIYYAGAPFLDKAFSDYVEFRKKIKKPMTDRAIELAKRNLEKLADNDSDRIEILNQSIMNGWLGLFELKKDNRRRDNENMFYNIGREEGIF